MSKGSDFGDFAFIGKDVLGIIVKFIPKGSRCNFICINSKIMNFILESVYQPWIPVKNYLNIEQHHVKSCVVSLIEETNASGLGLLHAIKYCNYNYFVKWRHKKFKSSWQNGIIYYYMLIVASKYDKKDDNHIKLVELLMKDKVFKKEKIRFDAFSSYIITNEMYMEWLCKTGNFRYICCLNLCNKWTINIVKIYFKYFKFHDKMEDRFLYNTNVFEFLLENNYFKLKYRHILNLCDCNNFEKAYKFVGNKYPDLVEGIKCRDLYKIHDILGDILNELVE